MPRRRYPSDPPAREQALPVRFAALLLLAAFTAQAAEPVALQPEQMRWAPALPGVETAWLRGAPDAAGVYVIRVRLAPGAQIPPHSHPDTRSTTVLSGTLWFGFGREFDGTRLVAFAAGAFYEVPAGRAHFLRAGEAGAVYEEVGHGPTANLMEQR